MRQGSRLLRPYHPGLDVLPFGAQQVVDAGDIACNPFDIGEAIGQIEAGARELVATGARAGTDAVVERIRARVGETLLYVSIDIDVLDPAHAPGTGTPDAGGLSSRELLAILRGLAGLRLAGAEVVEVSPAYDHGEITAIAAAHVIYELLGLMAVAPAPPERGAAK